MSFYRVGVHFSFAAVCFCAGLFFPLAHGLGASPFFGTKTVSKLPQLEKLAKERAEAAELRSSAKREAAKEYAIQIEINERKMKQVFIPLRERWSICFLDGVSQRNCCVGHRRLEQTPASYRAFRVLFLGSGFLRSDGSLLGAQEISSRPLVVSISAFSHGWRPVTIRTTFKTSCYSCHIALQRIDVYRSRFPLRSI